MDVLLSLALSFGTHWINTTVTHCVRFLACNGVRGHNSLTKLSPNGSLFNVYMYTVWASALCTFYNNPAPLNGVNAISLLYFSNPGTGADDAFVLKHGVWCNVTWPSHSRPAIAASARLFQICFSPLTFWPLVCLPTLCLLSPFYAPSHE